MQPINYMASMPDLGTAFARVGKVFDRIRVDQEQQQLSDQYKTDLQAALTGGDPEAFVKLAVKYPQQGANLKAMWEKLGEDQRKSELAAGQQAWYALNQDRPDIALGIIDEHALAMKNAGKDNKKLLALRSAVESDPASASQNLALFISTVAPKEFAETLGKLNEERRKAAREPGEAEKLDAEAKEARAKATKAAVDARFAESNAVIDLKKKGWDIEKIQNDMAVAKENSRIAALNAAIGREANQIRREELQLKRDEAVAKRDEGIATKTAEVTSARTTMDNFLNTADRIIATPNNVMRAAMGPLDSRLPTIQQDVADFEALVENFDAQAFLSQVPAMKGLGALSNAEGNKLGTALQSFSMKQSPERFVANVKEAQRLITKARKNLATKYGIPDTVADTPAAAEATPADDINALILRYAPPGP